MKFENSNVLITGGASGIGKLMGRIALEKGASCLIIWDINLSSIEKAKEELGKYGKVMGYINKTYAGQVDGSVVSRIVKSKLM